VSLPDNLCRDDTFFREWRVAMVNAIQNNSPVTENWVGGLRRSTDSWLQLAVAAASIDSDQRAVEPLRNEFANMQQMNDQYFGAAREGELHRSRLVRQ
jgi:hypothetical protein